MEGQKLSKRNLLANRRPNCAFYAILSIVKTCFNSGKPIL
jgi:hypothetical protein